MSTSDDQNTETSWKPIEYSISENQIVVDATKPPFDGSPVLLDTPYGMIEGQWIPAHRDSRLYGEPGEVSGFCWSTQNKEYELESISFYRPAPEKNTDRPEHPPLDEVAVLVLVREVNEWVEAWYDPEDKIWRAMDSEFTFMDSEVLALQGLPVLTDAMRKEILEHWKAEHHADAHEPDHHTLHSVESAPDALSYAVFRP